jgi:hypothetical protein
MGLGGGEERFRSDPFVIGGGNAPQDGLKGAIESMAGGLNGLEGLFHRRFAAAAKIKEEQIQLEAGTEFKVILIEGFGIGLGGLPLERGLGGEGGQKIAAGFVDLGGGGLGFIPGLPGVWVLPQGEIRQVREGERGIRSGDGIG